MGESGWWGRLRGIVLAGLLCTATGASAQVLYYQDADGVIHFTNRPAPGYSSFRNAEPLGEVRSSFRPRFRAPRDSGSYDDLILEHALAYEVEPALVKAVIRAESGFNRMAISPKGARGLMQLMPETARRHGVRNIFNPSDNIRGGVEHLRTLLDRYPGNVPWVLAAYNAGAGAVDRYRGIPPYSETRTYVSRVLRFRRDYLRQELLASR